MIFNRHTVLLWMSLWYDAINTMCCYKIICLVVIKALENHPIEQLQGHFFPPFQTIMIYMLCIGKKKSQFPLFQKAWDTITWATMYSPQFHHATGILNTQTSRHNSRQNSWTRSLAFGYVGELLNSHQFSVAQALAHCHFQTQETKSNALWLLPSFSRSHVYQRLGSS